MGRAPTLKDTSNNENEVIALFAENTAKLETALKPQVDQFNADIDKMYTSKNFKMLELGSGTKANYSDDQTFSLKGIQKILGDFATAIFDPTSVTPPPEGTKVNKGALETAVSAGLGLATYETLALKAATGLVLSLFGAFDTSAHKSTKLSKTHSMLSPGLMLHAYTLNGAFTNADFFGGRQVILSQMTFRLIYSIEQAKQVAQMEVMQSMENQLQDFIELLAGYMAQYKTKFSDIEYAIEHADQKKSYEDIIASAEKNRDEESAAIAKFAPGLAVHAVAQNMRKFQAI